SGRGRPGSKTAPSKTTNNKCAFNPLKPRVVWVWGRGEFKNHRTGQPRSLAVPHYGKKKNKRM
ncbi:hypothetical protein ACVGV6_00535, partial [Enterobacter sichuanensis]